MNKTYSFGILAFLLASLVLVPIISAEETEQLTSMVEVTMDAYPEEIVPSAFKFGWEKFKLNFVRNESLKAERELQLARWKAAEARIAVQEGNIERAEKAIQAQEKIMQKLQERMSRMNKTSSTPGLDNALQIHKQRMIGLSLALEEANLSEQQIERIQNRIDKIENVTEILEKNRERIQDRAQIIEGQIQKSKN